MFLLIVCYAYKNYFLLITTNSKPKTNQTKPNQTANQIKPNQTKPNQTSKSQYRYVHLGLVWFGLLCLTAHNVLIGSLPKLLTWPHSQKAKLSNLHLHNLFHPCPPLLPISPCLLLPATTQSLQRLKF